MADLSSLNVHVHFKWWVKPLVGLTAFLLGESIFIGNRVWGFIARHGVIVQ